jgi:hypothetical protein
LWSDRILALLKSCLATCGLGTRPVGLFHERTGCARLLFRALDCSIGEPWTFAIKRASLSSLAATAGSNPGRAAANRCSISTWPASVAWANLTRDCRRPSFTSYGHSPGMGGNGCTRPPSVASSGDPHPRRFYFFDPIAHLGEVPTGHLPYKCLI